jgi:hypothetical protein
VDVKSIICIYIGLDFELLVGGKSVCVCVWLLGGGKSVCVCEREWGGGEKQ